MAALVAALGAACTVVVTDGVAAPAQVTDPAVSVLVGDEAAAGGGEGPWTDGAFDELNAAFSRPLTVRVAPSARPAGPVVVVQWCATGAAATFPRLRVEVGTGAEVDVVELSASADVDALVVPVTEVEVADAARVGYVHLQQHGPQVWQIGHQRSRVGRDATFSSASIALGGDYSRLRTDSALVGQGGTSNLRSVYFGWGRRMVDLRTTQDHRAPRTTSELLFKGAVANRSHAVYTGLIRVDKGARGTNAFQTNRNLVLHDGARADSVPNLEIEENDVRCSHASAVGPIAADQRFYLESRGVPPQTADRLITLGFLDEVLGRLAVPPVVDHARLQLVASLDAAEREEAARP